MKRKRKNIYEKINKKTNEITYTIKFNYRNWQGEVKQKKKEGFKNQKEAIAFERSFREKTQSDPEISFGSLVNQYMDDCKARFRPTTFSNKKILINSKILPYFQKMPVNEIDGLTVRKWQTELLNDEKKYSPTYLKTINNQLSAIFNFAIRYYGLKASPARAAGSMGKKDADSMSFWTLDEYQKFLAEISDDIQYKVIYELLFWTGIRIGELTALTLDDFNFEAKTMSINKSYTKLEGKDYISKPKTSKSERSININISLSNLVQEYVEHLYDYNPTQRLFEISKANIRKRMETATIKAGLKKIRVHDLRHSHASLLIEQGFSPLLISERLGHEDIRTTLKTYSHLYPNKQGEVADRIEKLQKKV